MGFPEGRQMMSLFWSIELSITWTFVICFAEFSNRLIGGAQDILKPVATLLCYVILARFSVSFHLPFRSLLTWTKRRQIIHMTFYPVNVYVQAYVVCSVRSYFHFMSFSSSLIPFLCRSRCLLVALCHSSPTFLFPTASWHEQNESNNPYDLLPPKCVRASVYVVCSVRSYFHFTLLCFSLIPLLWRVRSFWLVELCHPSFCFRLPVSTTNMPTMYILCNTCEGVRCHAGTSAELRALGVLNDELRHLVQEHLHWACARICVCACLYVPLPLPYARAQPFTPPFLRLPTSHL